MDEKTKQYSPGKRYRLTFSDFEEPRMMMSICRFSIADMQTNKEINFNPLWAIGLGRNGFSWAENQNFVSSPVVSIPHVDRISESFLVYDIEKLQFASVHFSNCWVLNGHCHNDYIEIEYEDSQIPERVEHDRYPTKKFTKPANAKFKFSKLIWKDITDLQQFDELNKGVIIHEFIPVDNGWRQFKGILPQTTEVLVWRLKQFSEYGDIQSKNWFAEVRQKKEDFNYWVNASEYIGFKIRRTIE